MRALVQRVKIASVRVQGTTVAEIGPGLLVLLGVGRTDTAATAEKLAAKVAGLRIFEDAAGRMNRSADEIGGSVLCVSQFTLFGDVRRGRRPSFEGAATADQGRELYEAFCRGVVAAGLPCSRGVFGAHMEVALVNDGPVTIWIDSSDLEKPRH